MKKVELERLQQIEQRVRVIAEECGLLTTDIAFEIVPAQRMLEGMAYGFPTNFSHWSFGRDYDKYRTIYEHTGHGIPYEQVWNFEMPRALIVETNPFALNVTTIAHVYGHVDYFLGSRYLQHGRSFSDVAEEARNAASRFKEYEARYGKGEVERTIDAGMSIQWQQHPDPFCDEELDDEVARDRLMTMAQAKFERAKDFYSQFRKQETAEEIASAEKHLKRLMQRTPPQPMYDLLGYIIRYSPVLKQWQRDVLTVIRNQTRALAPNRRTKMLDEGWATYWHVHIMRRLFAEGLLTPEEHGIFADFHSRVTQEHKMSFNWYRIGLALFEHIKERWDKGQFGRAYEECSNPGKKAEWDVNIGKGAEKTFEVRSFYSDRMAIEEFFTDDFIRQMSLYFYDEALDPSNGDTIYRIVEDRPGVIRNILKQSFSLYGIQPIVLQDANYNRRQEFYLVHEYSGTELEPRYRDGTMEHLYYLWGRDVYLETAIDNKQVVHIFNGEKHKKKK